MKYANFSCKAYKQHKILNRQTVKTMKKSSYDILTFI